MYLITVSLVCVYYYLKAPTTSLIMDRKKNGNKDRIFPFESFEPSWPGEVL